MGREYKLANPEYRDIVDLRQFEEVIISTVKAVCPNSNVTVTEHSYTVIPTPTRAEVYKIGKQLAKSKLVNYSKSICSVFKGHTIDE